MSFFVIEAWGFKFRVLGILVSVFKQLEWCIFCGLPLWDISQKKSTKIAAEKSHFPHSVTNGGIDKGLYIE